MQRAYVQARASTLVDAGEWEGTFRSTRRVEIRADKSLKIKRVAAKNLDQVDQGQLLIEVDRTEIERKVREAEDRVNALMIDRSSAGISLNQKKKVFMRRKKLHAQGVVPAKELEEAERDLRLDRNTASSKALELAKAKRELESAKADLAQANFYAPIAGVVTGLPAIDLNDLVVDGALLAVVSDPTSLSLWIDMDETDRLRVKVGQKADIRLEAGGLKELEGEVKDVSLTPEPGTSQLKTYRARIDIAPGTEAVREGFRGKARIEFARAKDAVVVPVAALRSLEGKDVVVVAVEEGAEGKMARVTTGIRTKTEVEITSGLKTGDFVVIDRD